VLSSLVYFLWFSWLGGSVQFGSVGLIRLGSKVNLFQDMVLGVMFRLNLIWRDQRLQYNNIRTDQYLVRSIVFISCSITYFLQNDISAGKQAKMWIPVISFDNAKTGRIDTDESSDRLRIMSSLSFYHLLQLRLTVLKETERDDFSDIYAREEAIFPGNENSLSYYRR
jgi:hypothetical protein